LIIVIIIIIVSFFFGTVHDRSCALSLRVWVILWDHYFSCVASLFRGLLLVWLCLRQWFPLYPTLLQKMLGVPKLFVQPCTDSRGP
jgi:hypothetical protein